MTKSEMDFFDSSLLGPAMLFLNQYFNYILNEYVVLWIMFVSYLYTHNLDQKKLKKIYIYTYTVKLVLKNPLTIDLVSQ